MLMATTAATIETQYEEIGPGLASEYLKRNHCNRSISVLHRNRISRAMLSGEFTVTHQGIAFDVGGNLVDGQHRLAAIVDSGVVVTMLVTRGLPIESKASVDVQSRPRSAHDSLVMQGHRLATRDAVSCCRLMMRLEGLHSPAVHEIRDYLDQHTTAIEYAAEVAGGHKDLKHACVMAMLAFAYEQGHGDDLRSWAEVIRSGIASEPWHTSAVKFRDWWITTKRTGGGSQRAEYCQRVYASMSAWLERRGLSKLYCRQIEWLQASPT